MLPQRTRRRIDHEISCCIQREMPRALKTHADPAWVGTRCKNEVVFERPLPAVVDHVDSRIDAAIADAAEGRDIASPIGLVTDQIAHRGSPWLLGLGLCDTSAEQGRG